METPYSPIDSRPMIWSHYNDSVVDIKTHESQPSLELQKSLELLELPQETILRIFFKLLFKYSLPCSVKLLE
jgi:hypothetical protein